MRLTLFAVPMLGVAAAVAAIGETVPAQAVKAELRGAAQSAWQAQAVQAFRAGRYAAAYARFAALADGGDVPSAQIALLMVRQGPSLFGSEWFATPAQQMRWNALVVNAARGRLDIEDNERGD
jgi:hypothetical protein